MVRRAIRSTNMRSEETLGGTALHRKSSSEAAFASGRACTPNIVERTRPGSRRASSDGLQRVRRRPSEIVLRKQRSDAAALSGWQAHASDVLAICDSGIDGSRGPSRTDFREPVPSVLPFELRARRRVEIGRASGSAARAARPAHRPLHPRSAPTSDLSGNSLCGIQTPQATSYLPLGQRKFQKI